MGDTNRLARLSVARHKESLTVPAFIFAEKWADFRCNRQIIDHLTPLGLFPPKFLYLLATAQVSLLGFAHYGVRAESIDAAGVSAFSATDVGVWGEGPHAGVYATNFNPANPRPWQPAAYLATQNLAGEFVGDVVMQGSLTKSGGGFQIDHPLDPANKYLNHAFVESPEMKTVYEGVVTLDGEGCGTVELPEWFEALNRELRYQLTAIGAPAPGLHIAQELAGNRFKIAGGVRGMRVSWLVTGIRKDAWANAHPLPVEVEKTSNERGHYLHPELYKQPPEKGMVAARHHGMRQPQRRPDTTEELRHKLGLRPKVEK